MNKTALFALLKFLYFFTIQGVFCQITFDSSSLTTVTAQQSTVSITSLPNANTQTYFAFRVPGGTKWVNGVMTSTSYLALSDFIKVTPTSSSTGTAVLAPLTLPSNLYQEIIVVSARQSGWGLSVTSTSDIINNYPVSTTSTTLQGVSFLNLDSFIFGSSSGFSLARTTSGTDNYGTILATRIITIAQSATDDNVWCRISFNASGIIRSALLGSEFILSNASLVNGAYSISTTEERYLFQKTYYQLLSIFGSAALDVLSTTLTDCQTSNGTAIAAPTLDIYSISSMAGNITTSQTISQAVTCYSGCSACDTTSTCLDTSCLFNPDGPNCISSTQNCPVDRPYAFIRSDIRGQCFENLPNQMLVSTLSMSATQFTVGSIIYPVISTATTADRYSLVFGAVGIQTVSSMFFFPLNYGPRMSGIIPYAGYNTVYSYTVTSTSPFAPKMAIGVRLGVSSSTVYTMTVRRLDYLKSQSLGLVGLQNLVPNALQGYEFYANNTFAVVQGNIYITQFYVGYQSTYRLPISAPTSQILFFSDGVLDIVSLTSNSVVYNPSRCSTSTPCYVHIAFVAEANGNFTIDRTLLASGVSAPTTRPIKGLLMESLICTSYSTFDEGTQTCVCNAGYYPNNSTGTCVACYSTCSTCSAGTAQSCTSCKPTYIFSSGSCICQNGFYRDVTSNTCIQCDSTCSTCSGPTAQNCISCPSPFLLLSNGACGCANGFFKNSSAGTCDQCDTTCSTCSGSTAQNCTSCSSPFILSNGQCVCQNGFFRNSGACTQCDSTCSTCSGPTAQNCTSCPSPFILLSDGTCGCANGFFKNSSAGTCDQCDTTCSTCSGSSAQSCTSCPAPFILLSSGACGCANGFFKNSSAGTCDQCDTTCSTCSGSTAQNCTSCSTPFILSNEQCVCQNGFFRDAGACTQCDDTCSTCSGSTAQDCTSCPSPFILLNNGACGCANGFFKNSSAGTCDQCDTTCSTCSGSTAQNCTSCPAPFVLLNEECVCQDGFFRDAGTCAQCDETCSTCSGSSYQNCTSCPAPFILLNGECVCQDGFFRDEETCAQCNESCSTCSGSTAQNCTSCPASFTLSNGECICATGFFLDVSAGICAQCDDTCSTCSGPTAQNCTSCLAAFTLLNGECTCADGFFPNRTAETCEQCDETCNTCSGATAQSCTSCLSPFVLLSDGACGCANGFFKNSSAGTCDQCDTTCSTCSGSTAQNCTSCSAPFVLLDGECVCQDGFFRDAGTCVQCNETCSTCSGSTAQNCTSCTDSFTLSDGECICGDGYERDGDTCSLIGDGGIGGDLNSTNSTRDNLSSAFDIDTMESGFSWIKAVYIALYAVSFLMSLLWIKKFYFKVYPLKTSSMMTVVPSRTSLDEQKDSLKTVFINYSPLFFLINKKLTPKEKALRSFHMVFALNMKLFIIVVMTVAFAKADPLISVKAVEEKLLPIVVVEIVVTTVLSLLYSAAFQTVIKSPMYLVVPLTIGSIGITVLLDVFALSKLENGAGALLFGLFALSVVIDYLLISGALAALTMKLSPIKRLRKWNLYKSNDNKVQVASIVLDQPAATTGNMPPDTIRHTDDRLSKDLQNVAGRQEKPEPDLVESYVFDY